MDEALADIKNEKLRNFITHNAYERGHSAGEEEVNMIAHGLAYDLRELDEYITYLESLAGI